MTPSCVVSTTVRTIIPTIFPATDVVCLSNKIPFPKYNPPNLPNGKNITALLASINFDTSKEREYSTVCTRTCSKYAG